jgi:hypothetical protein
MITDEGNFSGKQKPPTGNEDKIKYYNKRLKKKNTPIYIGITELFFTPYSRLI